MNKNKDNNYSNITKKETESIKKEQKVEHTHKKKGGGGDTKAGAETGSEEKIHTNFRVWSGGNLNFTRTK